MGSEPAKHVRESFEKATKSYEERRLEPLPERELSLLEDWVSAVERGEMFAMHESFFVEAAMRNGFRPSEYMDSVFGAKIQQLRQMGLEPENLLPSVPQIRGVADFLEFDIRLKEWLHSRGKGAEFHAGLEEHSEKAFWDGCFLKDSGDWELANEGFGISLAGSLGRRMRFIALQNMAWCCVKLEQWDDALALYDELRRFAKIPDSREKAAECAGYIAALRDFKIVPDREFQLAPSPRECEELDIFTEANEILASKIISSKGSVLLCRN